MKAIVVLFFLMALNFRLFAQEQGFRITHYNYSAFHRKNNWHWLNCSYQHSFSQKWSGAAGLGLNITPLFRDAVFHHEYFPNSRTLAGKLNLSLEAQRVLVKPVKNVRCYVFDKMNLNYTSFDRTEAFAIDTMLYFRNVRTPKSVLVDNTLGVGLDVRLFGNFTLLTRIGVGGYYLSDDKIGKPGFTLCSEFGFYLSPSKG